MSAAGLELIGTLGLEAIRKASWEPDLVGGLTLGADPVAYSVALASCCSPPTVDAFTVRKEPKSHGMGRLIEGCFQESSQVVVVEDVITSGGSALRAIRALEAAGARVVGVLAVVDREEGGRETIEGAGYPLSVLVTLADLGVAPTSGLR